MLGPSVWRATATAVAYLGARLVDHRSPPWNAMAVAAGTLGCVAPLDVLNAGFALTFGATAALLWLAAAGSRERELYVADDAGAGSVWLSGLRRYAFARWLIATVLASVAVET